MSSFLRRRYDFKLALFSLWLVAFCVTTARGQPVTAVTRAGQLPAGVTAITEVEGIKEYRLANGLQVLLFPDHSLATTTVNITYGVGSRHENYGETGMAHLLEHMLFKGTPTHPNLWKDMSDRGFQTNGTTWLDRTNYFESFNASDDYLKWAIEMEADRMINSKVAAEDLATEMTVVRNEFEMGENDPFQVMLKRMQSVAYDWHAYGKSTIGNRSDIENVGIENLRAFYRRYYQPDNATLLIGGKFDPDKTLPWIAEAFSKVPKPTRTLPKLWTVEPTQDGERSFTVRRAGDVQLILSGYKVPPGTHVDYPALRVLAHILGNEASGRLKKSLVDTQLATSAFAFSYATYDPGMMFVGVLLRGQQDINAANAATERTLASLTDISAEEVTRAQNALSKGIDEMMRSPEAISVSMSEAIAQGDWRLLFYQRDQLKAVKLEDVVRVAQYYFKRDNRTTGFFIPTDAPARVDVGTRPDVVAILRDYKGDASIKMGEAFDSSPANIAARTQRFTLANGMQVALLPKSTRGESVTVSMTLRAGTLASLMGKAGASAAAADMPMRGTTQMSRAQIKDKLDALKTTARIAASGASLTTTRTNLVEALKLTAHVLKEANFPADEFAKLKQERLTNLEFARREPDSLAADKLAEHMRRYAKDDPRTELTLAEQITDTEGTTRDAAFDYYKRFVSTTDGQLAIIGDFDPNELRALVTTLFGEWRAPEPYARIVREATPPKPASFTLNAPDKENATLSALQPLAINDSHEDYPALWLANYMLGGHAGSRLFARVREKEGLSYGIYSSMNIPMFEPGGSFAYAAIAAPSNIGKAQLAAHDEITQLLTKGFTDEEVAKGKQSWLQARQSQRAQDAYVANTWNTLAFAKRDFMAQQQLEEKVSALTTAQVNAALRRHIDPAKMVVVQALDQAKAK